MAAVSRISCMASARWTIQAVMVTLVTVLSASGCGQQATSEGTADAPKAKSPVVAIAQQRGQHQPAITMRVGSGRQEARFTVTRPAGVVLLLRLTAPIRTRAQMVGSIPALAGVSVDTARIGDCRPSGGSEICTVAVEGCPLPAASWSFSLHKISGPAGIISLRFRVGKPRRA